MFVPDDVLIGLGQVSIAGADLDYASALLLASLRYRRGDGKTDVDAIYKRETGHKIRTKIKEAISDDASLTEDERAEISSWYCAARCEVHRRNQAVHSYTAVDPRTWQTIAINPRWGTEAPHSPTDLQDLAYKLGRQAMLAHRMAGRFMDKEPPT
jgi:hypothetical protein